MSYGSAYSNSHSEEPEYGTSAYDEEAAQEETSDDPRKGNWPFWCFPKLRCFYHNISREVRDKKVRPVVFREHLLWYVSLIAYFTNLVAESYRYHHRARFGTVSGIDLGISIAILLLVFPATFLVYFLLYGAARDVGKSWTWWWIMMPVQFSMELFFAIGIPKTGAAGLVQMIKAFEIHEKGVGFACLVVFLSFLALCATHIADYIILWRYRTALEGGYVTQKNESHSSAESQPIAKTEVKKQTKKSSKKAPKKDKGKPLQTIKSSEGGNASYKPPEPTVAKPQENAESSGGDPNWHKPTGSAYDKSGSAYEKTSTAYDKAADSSSTSGNPSDSANPFGGNDGGLDDFYH